MIKIQVFTTKDIYFLRDKMASAKKTYSFCHQLSKEYDVELVCIVGKSAKEYCHDINKNYTIRTVKSKLISFFGFLDKIKLLPIYYVFFFVPLTRRIARCIDHNRQIVVFENFMLASLSSRFRRSIVKVYSSHNVESQWYDKELKKYCWPKFIHKFVLKCIEMRICHRCDIILAPSIQDVHGFLKIYHIDQSKVVFLPSVPDFSVLNVYDAESVRRKYGLSNSKYHVVFCGSGSYTNTVAADFLIQRVLDKLDEDCMLVFVGGIGNYVDSAYPPKDKCKILGFVEDLKEVLSVMDLAVNPIVHPFGVNIKLLDYVESMLPVVTTEVGIRGFEFLAEVMSVSSPQGFADVVNTRKTEGRSKRIDYAPYFAEVDSCAIFKETVKHFFLNKTSE